MSQTILGRVRKVETIGALQEQVDRLQSSLH